MARVVRKSWGVVAVPALLLGVVAGVGVARAQQVRSPQAPAPRAPVPSDQFSPALGIYYNLVPYGRSWGARLSQYPAPGSPMQQIQLEPGDMIIALDGQPIYSARDLETHVDQTSVDFVNIRTNRPQRNWVFIAGGGGNTPPPPPSSYVLGVNTVPVAVNAGAAAAPGGGYPALRPVYGLRIVSVTPGGAAARAGLEVGDTILTANNRPTGSINDLRAALDESGGVLRMTVTDVRTGRNITTVAYPTPTGGAAYAAPARP